VWYWAHFPIVKEKKETTKIHPVFDGAAKFRGICINDYIWTGPTVMNELISVVQRFRQYDYAITGDVKEMFLQVQVPDNEKDYLRFLWYEAGKIVIYRYKVHLFGKCDSPCMSMSAIFLKALEKKEKYPEAFQTIANASLVNDMADSRSTKAEMQEVITQLREFFPEYAMDIRKFVRNSLSIMKDPKPELRVKGLEDNEVLQDMFDKKVPPCKVKVLGLLWDYVRDVIGFDFDAVEKAESPVTKMNMLITLHYLYDPQGVLIPFFITGKLQVHNCCAWDYHVRKMYLKSWKLNGSNGKIRFPN
jgi:hypothetical protein